MPETTPIAELADGSAATVRGRVERALRAVEGPDGVDCVFYDRGEAEDADGPDIVAFWLTDDTGRVLIPADFQVEGGALTHQDRVDVIDADVKQVASRLTDLKPLLREAQGRDQQRFRELHAEQAVLKELATVLCSIRAQAHGKVHGGGRSLEQQADFIRTRGERLRAEGHAIRSIELALEIRQTVVAVGDEVVVDAAFHEAPMPPGLGASGGYRDRPTCLQARARSSTEPIRVSPTRASHAAEVMRARAPAPEPPKKSPPPPARAATKVSRPTLRRSPAQIAGLAILAAMLAVYLYLIM